MKKKFKVGRDTYGIGIIKAGDIIIVEEENCNNVQITHINNTLTNNNILWSIPGLPWEGWEELSLETTFNVGNYGYCKYSGVEYLFLVQSEEIAKYITLKGVFSTSTHSFWTSSSQASNHRLATKEEIQWLDSCIKAGKYVEKEEALKPIIPEYVELTREWNEYGIVGRIYKVEDSFTSHWKVSCNIQCGKYAPESSLYIMDYAFKPSTKEAFEAQNSPKTEYYKCVESFSDSFRLNKIYKLTEGKKFEDSLAFIDERGKPNGWSDNNHKHFTPSTEAEYLAQNAPKKIDLLEEAKKRYPIGTKYKCLVIGSEWEITKEDEIRNNNGNIYTYRNAEIYHKLRDEQTSTWAAIIAEEKPKTIDKEAILKEAQAKFPKGTKFTNTNLYNHVHDILESIGKLYWSGEELLEKTTLGNGFTVYKNGQWAIPREALKSNVMIHPYKVGTKVLFREKEHIVEGYTKNGQNILISGPYGVHSGSGHELTDENGIRITSDGKNNKYFVAIKDLTLVEKQKDEYKIGDWVKSLKGNVFGHENVTGQIDDILNITSSYPYKINGIWSSVSRRATEEEIRQATAKKAETPILPKDAIDLKNTKIWIGDNAKLGEKVFKRLKELGADSDNIWKEFKQGDDYPYSLYISDSLVLSWAVEDNNKSNCFKYNPEFKEIFPSDLGIEEKSVNLWKDDGNGGIELEYTYGSKLPIAGQAGIFSPEWLKAEQKPRSIEKVRAEIIPVKAI